MLGPIHMTETLQFALSFAAILTPIVLAAFARDRALSERIAQSERNAILAMGTMQQKVGETYLRRDDFRDAMERVDKTLHMMQVDGSAHRAAVRQDLKDIGESINELALKIGTAIK